VFSHERLSMFYVIDILLQSEIPVEEVQVIHRYRPYSRGTSHEPKYQGFSRHVGSILKTKDFVDYYNKDSK